MHDLSQESWRQKRDLQDRLVKLIGSYGYRCLDTPILEPTELFLRKSGGELASRMYSFTDAGSNAVSLRPEFTAQIVRHYLEHAAEIQLPVRWQYAGPVFRYEASDPNGKGQFTQMGAELLGSTTVLADAELLSLAASVPAHLGLAGCRLELADLDVLQSLLDSVGVSERARTFIIASMSSLREGRKAVSPALEQARQLNLTGLSGEDDHLGQAVKGLEDEEARRVLQGVLQWSATDQLGQRNPDEVVDRLLRKVRGTDDESSLRRGLELAAKLAAVGGDPKPAIDAARSVVQEAGADTTPWERLGEVLDLLLAEPGMDGSVALDFGLVGGLAYYNGVIFEIKHPEWPSALGVGGRYDGLARALGSPEPVPALGFAFNLDTLLTLTEGAGAREDLPPEPPVTLVLAQDTGSYQQALRTSQELRRQGFRAELEVGGGNLSEALSYATKRGMTQVVLVDQDGQRTSYQVE